MTITNLLYYAYLLEFYFLSYSYLDPVQIRFVIRRWCNNIPCINTWARKISWCSVRCSCGLLGCIMDFTYITVHAT